MRAVVDPRQAGVIIDRHIYGHFSEHLGRCIYGGYWVGEDSEIPNVRGIRTGIVDAMRAIRVPNIRWPGGCFADDYHWMDGIGPRDQRPPIVNVHWGGVLENNHFGTHEFMDLCDQIGCEAYVCGNVGSGTVREMRNWVEYLTDAGDSPMARLRRQNGRDEPWSLPFFGVGNENWGCGGFMTAEHYANEYRKFAAYVKNYSVMGQIDWWKAPQVMRIAGGDNVHKHGWTETLMRSIPAALMGGLSVHCYVKPGDESHGTDFSTQSWYQTARNTMDKEQQFDRNISIMDYYDPGRKIMMAVDEWGMWVDNVPGSTPGFLFQQNTIRSAMSAALMLHMFHRHADRIRLANLAQTVNVLQSIVLTKDDQMILTPTYHVFDLFKTHQESAFIPVVWTESPQPIEMELPHIDLSASLAADGSVTVTLVNLSADRTGRIEIDFAGQSPRLLEARVLAGEIAHHNTFEDPEKVTTSELAEATVTDSQIEASVPPCGIASMRVELS